MKTLYRTILGNAGIVLGVVFLVFIILDWFNAYMNFIGSPFSVVLLFIMCIVSVINGTVIQQKMRSSTIDRLLR